MIKRPGGNGLLILTSATIVAFVFGIWELIEHNYFMDADPVIMHYLYITRGIASSLILASWAVWYVLRSRAKYEDELRRSEERYRNIVENTSDAIVSLSGTGVVLSWNSGAEKLYGYSASEALGRPLKTIPKEKWEEFLELIGKVGAGEIISNYDTQRLAKSGRLLEVSINLSPVKDRDGSVRAIVEIARDFTERNALHRKLMQTDKLATIGQLAAGLAHELNTPLSSILVSAQMLSDCCPGMELCQEDIRKIERQVKRCKGIVQALLDFSRPASDQKSEHDLLSLLLRSLGLLKHKLEDRNIRVKVNSSERDSFVLLCDENQIEQLFLNMLDNAIDAMPGGGEITISLERRGDESLEVRFSDTGAGIKGEDLPRIFDPFFTTKPAGSGTGLGLSICQRIAENHNATISVTSEVGKGTTFVINFPRI